MGDPVRMGIVGLGRAASVMLPSLGAHPGIRVVAGADPNAAAREQFAGRWGARTFVDMESMLREAPLDAVYIATPHQCHVEHALLAAGAGRHMIIEKPIALTLEDGRRIADAAARAGVVTLVGHTAGFDPAVRQMRALIEAGEVGAPRMITNLAYTDFLYRPRRPEELDTRQGGGIFYNQVPHQVEIARVLERSAVHSVRAIATVGDPQRPTEGAMSAFLTFASGAAASLVYSGYDRFDADELCFWVGVGGTPKTPAHGSARRALAAAGGDGAATHGRRGLGGASSGLAPADAFQPHFGMLLVSCERADLRISRNGVLVYGDDGPREIVLPPGRAVPNRDAVADDFHAAVVGRRPPLQDAAWGVRTLEVALAMLRSAQQGKETTIDPADPIETASKDHR